MGIFIHSLTYILDTLCFCVGGGGASSCGGSEPKTSQDERGSGRRRISRDFNGVVTLRSRFVNVPRTRVHVHERDGEAGNEHGLGFPKQRSVL